MDIKELYYNPRTGLKSANKFYNTFKPENDKLKFKNKVQEFVSNQEGDQLTKRTV